jgi:hypothetical protein
MLADVVGGLVYGSLVAAGVLGLGWLVGGITTAVLALAAFGFLMTFGATMIVGWRWGGLVAVEGVFDLLFFWV